MVYPHLPMLHPHIHPEAVPPMLTDAQCRNAVCPPDRKQARFADSGGMYLQVSPAGSKRWFLKYRIAGAEKQLALGSYPDVSLTNARKARDAAKLQKSTGADPVQVRKVEKLKATRTDGDTFKAVALEWYGKQAPQWSESHAERSLRQLERDLFPWIGDRPMIDIHPMELLSALQKVEERGAIETADRVPRNTPLWHVNMTRNVLLFCKDSPMALNRAMAKNGCRADPSWRYSADRIWSGPQRRGRLYPTRCRDDQQRRQ